MNILMLTNTFTPHVGGVARSVETFTAGYRALGQRVLVLAPRFEGMPESERDVIRVPAIQHFNGSDFSVPFPVPGLLAGAVERFRPDIVHSHHPYLLGGTALRIGASRNIPVVFTHHTMYERYTHYVPGDSPRMQRFVVDLATGYCDLCDAVIAPSESLAKLLWQRGVGAPIEVIPTGVDSLHFAHGDGAGFRKRAGIPADAFVVGHVGRFAPEKNLGFLAEALARFLEQEHRAFALLVGEGPCRESIEATFAERGLSRRLYMAGMLDRDRVADAYRAMDVFAFASQSETQGMVLTEAMAAGVPAVAVDASGVREVVRDRYNGRLLPWEDVEEFVSALSWLAALPVAERRRLDAGIAETADRYSMSRTAQQALALYETLVSVGPAEKRLEGSLWATARRRLEEEWKIFKNLAAAAGGAWLRVGGVREGREAERAG
jgi:glycosyltransferase involved in cell wall biosynthesis